MTLDINYGTTNPRKVDQLLEQAVEDIQDGTGLSANSIRAPLESEQQAKATWWALRDAPADYIGLIFFKDVGIGGSFWYSDGFTLNPCSPITLFSLTNLTALADTNNNTLFRGFVPPSLLGTTRELVFDGLFSFTNSANAKTLQITAGSFASPTVIGTTAPTTNASINFSHKWGNTGAANTQAYFPSLSSPYSITTSVMSTSSIDTAFPFHIGVNIQLANAGDTAKLNRLTVTLR